jgi:hypothetical protein
VRLMAQKKLIIFERRIREDTPFLCFFVSFGVCKAFRVFVPLCSIKMAQNNWQTANFSQLFFAVSGKSTIFAEKLQ